MRRDYPIRTRRPQPTLRPATTITEALAVDHAYVRQMIARLLAAPRFARQIYPKIATALRHHSTAEEQTLYQALSRYPDLAPEIAVSERQHRMLDAMLKRIDRTPYNHPIWISRFIAARQALESHLGVEETEVFDEARARLPLPQQRLLATRYRRMMNALAQRRAA